MDEQQINKARKILSLADESLASYAKHGRRTRDKADNDLRMVISGAVDVLTTMAAEQEPPPPLADQVAALVAERNALAARVAELEAKRLATEPTASERRSLEAMIRIARKRAPDMTLEGRGWVLSAAGIVPETVTKPKVARPLAERIRVKGVERPTGKSIAEVAGPVPRALDGGDGEVTATTLQEVLKGNADTMLRASFRWSTTKQGWEFWNHQHRRLERGDGLSTEARAIIEHWIAELEAQERGAA